MPKHNLTSNYLQFKVLMLYLQEK